MAPPPIPEPQPMDTELYEHLKKGLRRLFDTAIEISTAQTTFIARDRDVYARAAAEAAQALIALETLQLKKREVLQNLKDSAAGV